ncbi:MAG: hypothetical protein HY246_03705 [Proteobacteria bacterium]|nr:hypothetical protein [Pseudomonadota bacterium]
MDRRRPRSLQCLASLAIVAGLFGCQSVDEALFPRLPTQRELMQTNKPDVDVAALKAANDALEKLADRSSPLMRTPPRANSGVVGELDFASDPMAVTPATPVVGGRSAVANGGKTPPRSVRPAAGNSPGAAGSGVPTESVELDLMNASLRSVIEFMFTEHLKRPFTILPDFQDKQVNLLISGRYTRQETARMFEAFLDAHGVYYSAVDGVAQVATRPVRGTLAATEGQTVGIWRIANLDAKEVMPIARQFLSVPDRLQVLDTPNLIVAMGSGAEIRQVDNFISRVDTTFFRGKSIFIYGPRYITAPALVALLQTFPKNLGSNLGDPKKPIDIDLVPGEPRIVVVIDSPELKAAVLQFIEQVDRPGQYDRQVFFYTLRNQKAEEIRATIDNLLSPMFQDRAKIGIIANQSSNSLLITATPEEYYEVKKVIDALDFKIPTVLIDAAIVEVQLNGSLAYGVQWFLSGRRRSVQGDISTNFSSGDVVPTGTGATGGATIGVIALADNAFSTIDLLASQTDLRVLSRPRVLVQNTQPARIKSTDQIRVVKSVLTTTATIGGSSLPQREFIDKEVGVSLEVTPTIAEDGTISMKLKVTDSRRGAVDLSSGEPQPTFNVREVETTFLVQNGETILIGGLMQNSNSRKEQKIPFLGDLPLIGRAFANTTDQNTATELIVFVSPYIVLDKFAARIVTDAITRAGIDARERRERKVPERIE